MRLVGLLLVATVSLVHCQEKPLVRCKRPQCDMYCAHGFQVDANGCEVCSCRDPEPASTPIPALPCAEPMCANDCREFGGYKRNKHGCMTCECQERVTCEDIECSVGQFCHPDLSHCRPGMEEKECLPRPVCVEMDQMPGAPPPGCPMRKCVAHLCPYGLRRDKDKCPTCECAINPCETHECHVGQDCEVDKLDGCEGTTCPVIAKCTFKSLCRSHQHFRRMMHRGEYLPEEMAAAWDLVGGPLDYSPECREDGSFHSKQCDGDEHRPMCWCVNDLGLERLGSRRAADDLPFFGCERNHTESLEMKFQILHEFDNISPQLDDLKKTVRQHLSHWLTVREEFIVIVNIEADTEESRVQVHALIMQDGKTDLASAAFFIHEQMRKKHCNIHFKGQMLHSDPGTLKVTPRYREGEVHLPQDVYTEEEEDDGENLGTVIIVGCAGGALILFGLTVLMVVMARRNAASHQFKHQKFANYDKNLNQEGEIGMTHPDDKEKEPSVAIISLTATEPEKSSVA